MSDFQNLIDNVALAIGGTAPPSAQAGFYSGPKTGDGSGIATLKGAYSRPPFMIQENPVAVVLPASFKATMLGAPLERQDDRIRVLVMVKKVSMRDAQAVLAPFRTSVPAQLRLNFNLQPAGGVTLNPPVVQSFISEGKGGATDWGGETWWSLEFFVDVVRMPFEVYSTN